MRKLLCLAILILTSAVGACVPSVYPLYGLKDLRFDPALLGTWAEKPGAGESWTFAQTGETSYSLVIKDDEKLGTFDVHLLQLGKHRFLDIAPGEESLTNARVPDLYKAGLIPGHMFMKVTQVAPVLQLAMLDPDWLGKWLDAHPKDLAYRKDQRNHDDVGIILLAPTRDLQAFVLKHADDKDAFGDSSNFNRIR